MKILDLFKGKEKTEILTTHGVTGTDLQSGVISEDYNSDLQFPDSIGIFDEMRKSDGTVIAILRAIKGPIISAKWQVQPAWEDDLDKEIADFISHNLFEKIKFKHFLRESMGFLDFGFYYFEKNYEIVDGMIEWKEFAPRLPKAHYLWEIKGTEWIAGHPAGITQIVNSTDENKMSRELTIPWDKLILFSFEKEWNNYEGTSILRNAYKHFYYKDLLYKVASISAERYGVGIPVASVKSSINETNKNKLVEFLKNIRSNEQSYGVYTDDATDVRIMTPEGSGVGSQMQTSIDHHDRKIYDSILAGFLNLSTGDGGSNALSKDQSSFFLRGLQGTADFFIDTMNEHIRELVDLNYKDIERYPTLTVSDIGSISMDEQINSIGTAVDKGLLDINNVDKDFIRATLKLPALPETDEVDTELDDIESDMEMEALEISTLDDYWAPMEENTPDSPPEDPTALSEDDDYELCEFLESIELNVPMSDETKKKISEALTKNGIKPGKKGDASVQAQSDFIAGDSHVAGYQKAKENITKQVDTIKAAMQSVKDKRATMTKVQKKKFATVFKAKIAELKTERTRLQGIAKGIKSAEKARKTALKWAHREVKQIIKSAKEADRATAKSKAISDKAIKAQEKENAKKKSKKLSESLNPTDRETAFTKNITSFEQFLDMKYAEAEWYVKEAEKAYQEALTELYTNSDSQRIDWVVCLVYDKTRITAGKNKVQKITDKLQAQLIDSPIQNEIFNEAKKWAKDTLDTNDTFLAKRVNVAGEGQINTFIDWYKSNMQGVIYNESRRVLENITLNYGSESSVELAKKTAQEISINKNILSLSFITHPRALYKFIIYSDAQAEGFTMFKTIVPTSLLQNVIDRPFGMTASIIFTIQTAAQINQAASVATSGKTAEAVTGLGLHHGSFEYYYPIASTDLEIEEEIARIQREELQKKMDNNK